MENRLISGRRVGGCLGERTAWEPWYCEEHLPSLAEFLEEVGENEGSKERGSPQYQVLERLQLEMEGYYVSTAEECEGQVPDDWFPEADGSAHADVGVLYEWIESHYEKLGWDGVHDDPDSSSDSE